MIKILILAFLGILIPTLLDIREHIGKDFSYKIWWEENRSRIILSVVTVYTVTLSLLIFPDIVDVMEGVVGVKIDDNSSNSFLFLSAALHGTVLLSYKKNNKEIKEQS